jgi:hypothetical protein
VTVFYGNTIQSMGVERCRRVEIDPKSNRKKEEE